MSSIMADFCVLLYSSINVRYNLSVQTHVYQFFFSRFPNIHLILSTDTNVWQCPESKSKFSQCIRWDAKGLNVTFAPFLILLSTFFPFLKS